MIRRARIGQFRRFGMSESKHPSIGLKDVILFLGTVASLVLAAAKPDVPSWAFLAPVGFLVVLLASIVWPWIRPRLLEWWRSRELHKKLLREWPRFRGFQHRLHDLLQHDSTRRVQEPLQKLLALECQGKSEEVAREKQARYHLLNAYASFASEQIGRHIQAAARIPKSFEEGRELAWEFQGVFTSLDSLGVIGAFLAAKTTAGHEGWYADWFDRMKALVMEYETFANEANRAIGDHVFWVHVRLG